MQPFYFFFNPTKNDSSNAPSKPLEPRATHLCPEQPEKTWLTKPRPNQWYFRGTHLCANQKNGAPRPGQKRFHFARRVPERHGAHGLPGVGEALDQDGASAHGPTAGTEGGAAGLFCETSLVGGGGGGGGGGLVRNKWVGKIWSLVGGFSGRLGGFRGFLRRLETHLQFQFTGRGAFQPCGRCPKHTHTSSSPFASVPR